MKFGNATNLLDSDKRSLSGASINKHRSKDKYRHLHPLIIQIIKEGSQISLFTKCFLNQQVLIIDLLILASAALSLPRSQYCKGIQILYAALCQHGASLKCNLVIAGNVGDCCRICRPLDSVSLVFSLGKNHFGKIYIYNHKAYSLCDV